MPVIIFLLWAFISFATGRHGGTMAIMLPIVVPLSVALPAEAGLESEASFMILLGGIGLVLVGSVGGNHYSPNLRHYHPLKHGHELRSYGPPTQPKCRTPSS